MQISSLDVPNQRSTASQEHQNPRATYGAIQASSQSMHDYCLWTSRLLSYYGVSSLTGIWNLLWSLALASVDLIGLIPSL